jgi:hypothetical protein
MNRAQNLEFPTVSRDFLGTQKISKRGFPAVSWDFKERACPKFFGTRTSSEFSWDFEVSDPTKKLLNPRTYPRFSWEFEAADPPKNLANPQISLDRKPGNCEV